MARKASKTKVLLQEGKNDRSHAVRRDEAERRLLSAAARLVADHGIEGLTFENVGEAAGFSRGLPRHYFGKKSDLLNELATFVVNNFARHLAEASQRKPGLENLLFAVKSYFDGAATAPADTRALLVVIAESLRETSLLPTMSALTDRSVAQLARDVREGISRGEISSDVDPEMQAKIILATLRSSVIQWMVDPDNIDIKALRNAYVLNLERALSPK